MLSIPIIKLKMSALTEPVRIGIALGLGFLVTVVLFVVMMVVGFSYMANIQLDLEQITKVNNVKTELAHAMKYMQRERSMSLYALASMDDAFEKDEELRNYDSHGAQWWVAWQQFQALGMNAEEKELVDPINTLVKERHLISQDAIALVSVQHGQAVSAYLRNITLPAQQVLSMEIDKLLSMQQERTLQAAEHDAEAYAKTRLVLLWLCTLTMVIGIVVAAIVVKRVMRQSRELEYKALFDGLTGLPNRNLFFDRLKQAAQSFRNDQKPFSVVLIDLNRFKEVNDLLGHHVGDLLLKHISLILISAMRRTDTVARLGGDEFVLLMPGSGSANTEIIIKKLIASVCHRANLGGNEVEVSCSMGIASFPEHEQDTTRLLLKADVAMYAAKRANVGYRIYTPEIEALAVKNVEMQNELRVAIEQDQLQLHYQPKISHHTGGIMGVEALVRWNHPQRGLVPPDDFIPLAEATGLIQPLTLWVLKTALQQSAQWHVQGHTFSVSINLSTRNLLDVELPERVANLLTTYRVQPEWLVFEITESAVIAEPARALNTLLKLNKMGIQLSLDDFGTGYSSLAYLKKLPVSEIKIDKSFIKDMEIDSSDTVIVRSTIALGHNLGMKVVAEGVENIEIWELLTALGCDASQGYFMSRPLSVEALDAWLATSAWAKEKIAASDVLTDIERRKNVRLADSIV